jgi:hypothetical protein
MTTARNTDAQEKPTTASTFTFSLSVRREHTGKTGRHQSAL